MSNNGANSLRKRAIEKYYLDPNYCLHCNKMLDVKDYERASMTRKRRFCNASCSASYNNTRKKKKAPSKCLHCSKDNKIRKNKFCCSQCSTDYRYNEYIKRWLNGEESGNIDGAAEIVISTRVRRWFFEKYDSKCQKCGWGEVNPQSKKVPLTVHHKDGNCLISHVDNLELLCPNCHSLTGTYGGMNKGNSKRTHCRK